MEHLSCPQPSEAFGAFPAWDSSWKICWKAGSGGCWTNHWIGFVGENFNRKPMGFYHQILRGFRLKFSHHPILWFKWMLPPNHLPFHRISCDFSITNKQSLVVSKHGIWSFDVPCRFLGMSSETHGFSLLGLLGLLGPSVNLMSSPVNQQRSGERLVFFGKTWGMDFHKFPYMSHMINHGAGI